MTAKLRHVDSAAAQWVSWLNANVVAPPEEIFTYNIATTMPRLVNPLSPKPSDNIGWDGSAGITMTGDQTVPANTTWSNRTIHGNVWLTDKTSILDMCFVDGRTADTSTFGLVNVPNGGQIYRTTIRGKPGTVQYWVNGVRHTGGELTVDRTHISRVVDCIRTSGASAQLICKGSWLGNYAFFNNDNDHSTGTPPFWTHNDSIQVSSTSTLEHQIFGNWMECFADVTGVTWSGGTWGSGTASNGVDTIGNPAAALNAGYWTPLGKCNWANGLTFSNTPGHKAFIDANGIDGVNATSGMMQFTPETGTTNIPKISRNLFGLGGHPSGSGKIYLVSYPSGTAAQIGTGANANKFGVFDSVPIQYQGDLLTFTAGGASIVP